MDDKNDLKDNENSFENDSNISVDVKSSLGSIKDKNDEVCFAWQGVIKIFKTNKIDNITPKFNRTYLVTQRDKK